MRNQFALQLPPELLAEEYEIQVGIYSSTSGQRYNLIEAESTTYIVVQHFTIEEWARLPESHQVKARLPRRF